MQFKCHQYLSGLRKYSLPEAGMFRYLVCPHYTCECLLYLSLAIVAAPEGQLCNRTILCGLGFVAANLGITASGTRKWYSGKFGSEQIKDKWNMIPFVY
jgi:3-oxo-5-alpha-steroid 4-dehydrogenase 3 / polyprenol reductase